jgi:antitoxin component of MazEF toxin-antitoxin module
MDKYTMKAIQKCKMPLEIPLRRVGNSLMITIPQTLVKLCGLKEGSKFEVEIDKEFLILKGKRNHVYDKK